MLEMAKDEKVICKLSQHHFFIYFFFLEYPASSVRKQKGNGDRVSSPLLPSNSDEQGGRRTKERKRKKFSRSGRERDSRVSLYRVIAGSTGNPLGIRGFYTFPRSTSYIKSL